MPETKYNYKNAEVLLDYDSNSLKINGKKVEVYLKGNRYFNDELPYQSFDRIEDIAEGIIDSSPNFKS